jgi:heme-degrading monooxygenase HmoA
LLAGYTYLWEFHVAGERRAEFEIQYGPGGAWVSLFRQSPGYLETLLLRDPANDGRYVTIDRWESEAAYQAFRARFAAEYRELDERCQHLTTKELSLGHYAEVVA